MSDDTDAMVDNSHGLDQPDPSATASDDLLGASVVPDINHPGTGWNVYEGGQLLFNILKSNVTPGGFDIHKLGTSGADADDMGSIMDALAFSLDDIRFPWSPGSDDADAASLVGTPEHDAQYWQPQTTAFTCAVQAQRGIIEAFTGQPVSEAQLVYEATVNGWLTDGGMSPHDVGNLLELHGIPCHAKTGANIEELMAELAQGRKVIVGVDAGEVWRNDFPLEDFFHQSADHAIWVTGVDMTDPANPKVIVNDSGDPSGAGKAYDLAMFKDAWQDSGFFYVATDDAAPDMALAANQGFDQAAEVFPAISSYFGKVYEDFREHLQDRMDDHAQVTPSEVPAIFTDAAVRAFVANLPKSPMASLNESTADTLFRVI
jgi:hypothetical protein